MQNQYFGDIQDFRKYFILRCLNRVGLKNILYCWMLTPGDRANDGNKIKYLARKSNYKHADEHLYDFLKGLILKKRRMIEYLAHSENIIEAQHATNKVPLHSKFRDQWFNEIMTRLPKDIGLVFFDPDNGIEVKTHRYGTAKSNKYLYVREIRMIWSLGHSVVIYQHKHRKSIGDMVEFIREKFESIVSPTSIHLIEAPSVLYILILQNSHQYAIQNLRKIFRNSCLSSEIRLIASPLI